MLEPKVKESMRNRCMACVRPRHTSGRLLPLRQAPLMLPRPTRIQRGSSPMKYLHTMVRVTDLDAVAALLLRPARAEGSPPHREREGPLHAGLPRAARPGGRADRAHLQLGPGGLHRRPQLRPPRLRGRRHLRPLPASCMKAGVTINRPPRDGRMAFVRSPDNISVEILQKGARCRRRSRGRRCPTPAPGSAAPSNPPP